MTRALEWARSGLSKAEKKPIQVATRCSVNHWGAAIAGTAAVAGQTGAAAGGTTYRWSHVMKTDATNLQIGFANFYPTTTTESSNANDISVAVTLEYDGLIQRLHFNGERVKKLSQGGFALTDPFWKKIPKGATFFTRVWVSVPVDGNVFPQGMVPNSAIGEGKAVGDLTLTVGALTATTENAFGPAVIVGVPVEDDAVAFGLFGDSMVADAGGDGWPVQATKDLYANAILSKAGSDVSTYQQNSGNAYRMRLAKYFTHAIVTFSSNDWNLPTTFDVQESYMYDFWDFLDKTGLIVYQATGCPRTSSTDNWNTTANQTTYNGNSFETKRQLFNKKLRTKQYPVRVLDVAAAIEASPGKWKAAYTGDGIHPLAQPRTEMVGNIYLGVEEMKIL